MINILHFDERGVSTHVFEEQLMKNNFKSKLK